MIQPLADSGFIKQHADKGHSRMRDDDFIGFFNDETQVVHPDGEEGFE